ncbi:helix-turn-helix domain-containing protein [Demequina lignilytica]|uniref:XRE family transcriptional regulator n=1 Tax=Demequina lignilytica TaxID=3051663 RepID=A0AAW7MA18_9MICO|nr:MULTISPECIES: XRE family transcriptional regulator [unclassified Demequina]MDN4478823.1 XRE family transcriptional regulator [Demequina sp. SYSU T00039-1]MDN4484078.1 XRE family transcriptional regulator [Demequina sp. SYSU T0a273]MDN4488921.1 XRE family transcriptional regulator [Demequina sp. SYSU T00039]MDN4490339.1 XRE family transcriptional regulator [Demequina sp. SYSU T00068]
MTESTTTSDEGAARLGARLRELRQQRRMTLVQLAAATDLSHPFLSQVERGLANLSLPSLRRIARALETSPVELMAAAESDDARRRRVEVTRAAARRPTPDGFARGVAQALVKAGRPFMPILVESESEDPEEPFVHAEDEFVLVLDGRVVLETDGRRHELGPGDSVYFAGGVRHRVWSQGGPYRLLVVKEQKGT